MKTKPFRLILTADADLDFEALLDWGEDHFGVTAVHRYRALLAQALADLCEDPERPGTRPLAGVRPVGLYVYHLQFSRKRVAGDRVKSPRHFIVYRIQADTLEVLRILRDNRILALHLPSDSP